VEWRKRARLSALCLDSATSASLSAPVASTVCSISHLAVCCLSVCLSSVSVYHHYSSRVLVLQSESRSAPLPPALHTTSLSLSASTVDLSRPFIRRLCSQSRRARSSSRRVAADVTAACSVAFCPPPPRHLTHTIWYCHLSYRPHLLNTTASASASYCRACSPPHTTTLSPNIDNACSGQRLTLTPSNPHEPLDCLPL
jgi:hypothetical protein